MDSGLLAPPFEAAALAAANASTLKSSLLKQVDGQEAEPMAQKVRFANETLLPLFNELECRNPTPDLNQQIPLLKGIWLPVWSTIPFQDIIPGRVHHESYQIFDDKGFYANLARYKPGRKTPILSWVSRWLLSYDFMIMQSYEIQTLTEADHPSAPGQLGQDYWEIQNVCIRQILRFGSPSFSAEAAQTWFNQTVANYQKHPAPQPQTAVTAPGKNRVTTKQYEQISQARPRLDHLYIDQDFRLVKTQREKSQRPSYTVALRLPAQSLPN
ncbi:hypothetical protein VB780_29310 [Leptolyngbya sp. CCNP1308]|uniref:hypothetical protein n=1 Tax=Leptolyngbya sp. CCNP1308 TaxID=3110255 RepID=UPI002B1F6E1C|nr:hypothetical protein [Leptolyngbya sp. CCNP1308]MEA5452707.1 hypothetical protein [Leptolyngbya sp. CCNP1308]